MTDQGEESGDDEAEDDTLAPSYWAGVPDVCGSCIAFRPEDPREGETVAPGACQLRPEIGRIPGSLKKCSRYMPRGKFHYQPGTLREPTRKRSKLVALRKPAGEAEPVRVERYVPTSVVPKDRPARAPGPTTIDLGGEESAPVIRQALVELVRGELGRSQAELHTKFKRGGRAEVRSADGSRVQAISSERMFASLDRFRSSLLALESALARRRDRLGEEQAELVESLRAIRGSMTTFNVLFSDKEDYFSSKE